MEEYHEDTVEKHEITKEEILFLKELQKEMNTQDTVCQADPRFWVIEGSERVYTGAEYANNSCMIASDDGTVIADTLEEAIKYFKDNFYISTCSSTYIALLKPLFSSLENS